MLPQAPYNHPEDQIPENIPAPIQIQDLQRQIAAQAHRLAELEGKLPDTNLLSRNYLTRAFAVWGHYFVSNLILGLIIAGISLVISIVVILIFGLTLSDLQLW